MRRRTLVAAVVLVGVFAPLGVAVALGAESPDGGGSVDSDSCQNLVAGDAIDTVLLVDESRSMTSELTERVQSGILIVGTRLDELTEQGILVSLAVVGFGNSETVLQPIGPIQSSVSSIAEKYVANQNRTDYRVGLGAAKQQFRSSTSNARCRILLWFTDGVFDIGDNNRDSLDGPAVIESVCQGTEAAPPLAEWFEAGDIRSYVILTNSWNENRWEEEFSDDDNFGVVAASLSVMQAITGDDDLSELETSKGQADVFKIATESKYTPNVECDEFVGNRDNAGEIRANPGDVDDIFDILLSQVLGDEFAKQECPIKMTESDGSVRSGELPYGLLLDSITIRNLVGKEDDLDVFAIQDGQEPKKLTVVNARVDFAASGVDKNTLPSGWEIEVTKAKDLEICISYPPPAPWDDGQVPVTVIGNTTVEAGQNQVKLQIDWKNVDLAKRAINNGFDLDDLLTQVAPRDETELTISEGFIDGSITDMVLAPKQVRTINEVNLWVTFDTGDGNRRPVIGKLDRPITVIPIPGSPELLCSDGDNPIESPHDEDELRGGEVPKATVQSSVVCTITAPDESGSDPGIVSFEFDNEVNDQFAQLGLKLQVSGHPDAQELRTGQRLMLQPGGDPVTIQLGMDGPLENRAWTTSGSVMIQLNWRDQTQEQQLDVYVDLAARSDTSFALLITLAISALALLLSLVVFRVMNSFVRIPRPDQFYARSATITITDATTATPQWTWVDPAKMDDTKLVHTKNRGIDLQFESLEIRRRLPPFLRPFSSVNTELSGYAAISSKPTIGARKAPGSFTDLTVIACDQTSAGEHGVVQAEVLVLHPRRSNPLLSTMKSDIDKLVPPFMQQFRDAPSVPNASGRASTRPRDADTSATAPPPIRSSENKPPDSDTPAKRPPPPRRDAPPPRPPSP